MRDEKVFLWGMGIIFINLCVLFSILFRLNAGLSMLFLPALVIFIISLMSTIKDMKMQDQYCKALLDEYYEEKRKEEENKIIESEMALMGFLLENPNGIIEDIDAYGN